MNITDYYKVNTLVRADTTSTILNIKIGREIVDRRLGGIEVQPDPSLLKQLNTLRFISIKMMSNIKIYKLAKLKLKKLINIELKNI